MPPFVFCKILYSLSRVYCQIKPLYVILSGENRRAVCSVEVLPSGERGKTEERSDDGIWLGVLVACHGGCNFPLKSHRDL